MAGVERGSLIIVSIKGDHGKPRPAVVIQNERMTTSDTVLVCLVSSDLESVTDARIILEPTPASGLRQPSLIMTDKIYPIPTMKCGAPIGHVSLSVLKELNAKLTFVFGLGD